jgi:hypothetical protein
MLNNMDDEEAKLILIKLLGILGKSLENKVIIGRNDGFRKLLGLMLERNEDILKEIIGAFKQILDVGSEKEELKIETSNPPDMSFLSSNEIKAIVGSEVVPSESFSKVEAPRPSLDVLKKMNLEMSEDEDEPSSSPDTKSKKERMTCLSLFKTYEENPFEEAKNDAIAEEMVIQGTLGTLKDILLTARRDLQIDLLQIIAKLLVKSTYNQREFQYTKP